MPRIDQVFGNPLNSGTNTLDMTPKGYSEAYVQTDALQSQANLFGFSATWSGEVAQEQGTNLGANALDKWFPDWMGRMNTIPTLVVAHEQGRVQDMPGKIVDVVTGDGVDLTEVQVKVVLSYFDGRNQAADIQQAGLWLKNLVISDRNNKEYYLKDNGTDNGDGTYTVTLKPMTSTQTMKVVSGVFTAIPTGTLFGIRGYGYDPYDPTLNSRVWRPTEKYANNITFLTEACKNVGTIMDARPNLLRMQAPPGLLSSDAEMVNAFTSNQQRLAVATLTNNLQISVLEGDANLDPNRGLYRGWGLFKQVDQDLTFTHVRGRYMLKNLKRQLDVMKDRLGTSTSQEDVFMVSMPRNEYVPFMENVIEEHYGKNAIRVNQNLLISEQEARIGIKLPEYKVSDVYLINGMHVMFREDVSSTSSAYYGGNMQNTPYRNEGPASYRVIIMYMGKKPQSSISGDPGLQGGQYCINFWQHERYGALRSWFREGISTLTGELKQGYVDSFVQQADELLLANLGCTLEFNGALSISYGR